MHILHINSLDEVSKIDKLIEQGKNIFILVYMVGCGPCNATIPEWSKMVSALEKQYSKNEELVIIDINKDFVGSINQKYIGEIEGFPTIKYINNNGNSIEDYEDSSINKKDRSVDSFINWVESKINSVHDETPQSSASDVFIRLSNNAKSKTKTKKHKRKSTKHYFYKNKKGGKWSLKYKKSINCNKPKGFSQKQYCNYGRKTKKNT